MALENRALEIRKEAALTDVQQEYPKYFDALKVHPRLLVGNTVPAIGREGTETLRDSADAKDWQDAVKQILAAEVQERARAAAEEDGGMMRTLHDAIELFQNNADMCLAPSSSTGIWPTSSPEWPSPTSCVSKAR